MSNRLRISAVLLAAFVVSALTLGQVELLRGLAPRNLGSTAMAGRVSAIAVYEKEPRIFYVGSASGGLFKTLNGGLTLSPVFERESSISIGAVAVCQSNPDIVWVGTGEQTSRNSVAWGDGVYKSVDGGKTWTHMGLKDTKHIGDIYINPSKPDEVFVGALGHLWGPNEERGLYRTVDGGKTWERVLYVDDKTGVIDMAVDPKNPRNMLVAMWQRDRKPWTFISGGPGSGLYRSTDGGRTFKKVTKGMPEGPIGRMGIDYFYADPKVVIATIENKEGGFFRSTDGGESWTRMSRENPRPFYFSVPRQDPLDANRVYVPGVQMRFSEDQGKTFRNFRTTVHVDHHAMWIDPKDNNHMIIGQDGGVGLTRDRGDTWQHLDHLPVSQFYAVAFDFRRPYYVYGGLQDNGTWGAPTQTYRGGVAFFDWFMISGGDGFHVQVDPTDWATVYSESQGGAIGRSDLMDGSRKSIRPRAPQGERYRFNWSSPIVLSPHNPRTVYFGGNRLFRSVNRGDSWDVISPDLTTNDPDKQRPGEGSVTPENTGAERHCTIITISESPLKPGLIWVGTDDGLVHVTKDGGVTWENVVNNVHGVPQNTWCSRVTASRFAEGRAYATFDGHRMDDYNMYVYVTEDYGQTWTKITNGLTQLGDCAYVIKEGLNNPELLYLGTEMGLHFSLDRGMSWTKLTEGFPTVAVHDLEVHPRELDLVIGTHGRGIWTLDVNGLEALSQEKLIEDVVLAKPQDIVLMGGLSGMGFEGDALWVSRNSQPGTRIWFYSKEAKEGNARITITNAGGETVGTLTANVEKGMNVAIWTPRGRTRIVPGDYRVTLRMGEMEYTTSVKVLQPDKPY